LKILITLRGELKESFFMAMSAIAAHKLRSALTLLGVLVGVFSIIVVMTVMRAMRKNIEGELSQLSGETFVIQRYPALHFEGNGNNQEYWRRKRISLQQGLALQSRATLPRSIGLENGLANGNVTSRYAKGPPNIWLAGETPGSFPAKNWTIEEGRALLDTDVDSARDVCVLGNSLAKDLFPYGSAVGERVTFNGVFYTVVGVLEAQGTMEGGRQDNFMVIPLTTGINRYEDMRWLDLSILVQARSAADYDQTVDEVRSILRLLRKVPPGKEDDFEIYSNDSLLDQMKSFTYKVRLGITLVSSIALLAAGVGIMNIMLVSVTERTREIGIRRAVGAHQRDILQQFLLESSLISGVGAVLGIFAGVSIPVLVSPLLPGNLRVPVPWIAVILALAVCCLTGTFFGYLPATRASALQPTESLRHE
jgi:putative ABC transport system permease protein